MCPSAFLEAIQDYPRLGYGIALKDSYGDDLLAHVEQVDWAEQVDWLEVIAENYLAKGGRSIDRLQRLVDAGFGFASHGVNLSIGSVDPLNMTYLSELEALFERIQPVWFSDHLCFTSHGGHYSHDLLPLPFNEESAAHCIERIQQVKSRFEIPFLIENISYYARFEDPGWHEARWLTTILEEADCGLLLDVNNVYVNARNHGGDPMAFIQSLPLERVVEIHMAGHLETEDLVIDTHGAPIRPEVLSLFAETAILCPNLKGVLLERDNNLPPFAEMLAELQTLRQASVRQGAVLS